MTTLSDLRIEELNYFISKYKKAINLFNYWYENDKELYTSEKGHKVEKDWLEAGTELPNCEFELKGIKTTLLAVMGTIDERKWVWNEEKFGSVKKHKMFNNFVFELRKEVQDALDKIGEGK